MKSFRAKCGICGQIVTAVPMLDREQLKEALAQNTQVQMMHTATQGDHVWNLGDQDKANLRNQFANGIL